MSDFLPAEVLDDIRRALAAANKIEAIKIYREATGLGLAESKAAVEAFEANPAALRGGSDSASAFSEAGDEPGWTGSIPAQSIDRIRDALFAGRKIEAIKIYREATGPGLKESKDLIDVVEARLRVSEPERFTAAAGKGCGAAVLAFGIVVVLAWRLVT
jgi:ribosomal protein L7/L12